MTSKPTREGTRPRTGRRYRTSPFRDIERLADDLGRCFDQVCRHPAGTGAGIVELSERAALLNRRHSEACLASVHVLGSRPHSNLHPLLSVFLADSIAAGLKLSAAERGRLRNAALTANLGMFEHHDRWAGLDGPLDAAQCRQRDRHPLISVERLDAAGIGDRDWLTVVLQHHEHADGSGYPGGLPGTDIRRETMILTVVDRYLAFVMPRLPRRRAHPTTALKHIYEHTAAYDETVIAALIRQLGIYPPGTAVRLGNGDIAVVTGRRVGDAVHPQVVSVGDAAGRPYDRPVPRDTCREEFAISDLYTGTDPVGIDTRLMDYWSDDEE